MTLRGRSHQKRRPPPLAGLQVRVVWQTVRPGSVCHRLAAGFGTCSTFMGSVACGATCLPLQLPELQLPELPLPELQLLDLLLPDLQLLELKLPPFYPVVSNCSNMFLICFLVFFSICVIYFLILIVFFQVFSYRYQRAENT